MSWDAVHAKPPKAIRLSEKIHLSVLQWSTFVIFIGSPFEKLHPRQRNCRFQSWDFRSCAVSQANSALGQWRRWRVNKRMQNHCCFREALEQSNQESSIALCQKKIVKDWKSQVPVQSYGFRWAFNSDEGIWWHRRSRMLSAKMHHSVLSWSTKSRDRVRLLEYFIIAGISFKLVQVSGALEDKIRA